MLEVYYLSMHKTKSHNVTKIFFGCIQQSSTFFFISSGSHPNIADLSVLSE